jgi:hypothetical protein
MDLSLLFGVQKDSLKSMAQDKEDQKQQPDSNPTVSHIGQRYSPGSLRRDKSSIRRKPALHSGQVTSFFIMGGAGSALGGS